MRFNVKNRFQAAAIHFSFSLIIISLFIFTLLFFWYPAPYFSASGGWQGLKIVLLVDLVLGPLLTLLVFNLKKSRKELATDLSAILIVQIIALAWGVTQVYQQRPIAIVFWEDRFYTVPAEAYTKQGIDTAVIRDFGDGVPVPIYAQKPKTAEIWNDLIAEMQETNIPPHHMLKLYRPLVDHFDDILQFEVDIHQIIENNQDMKLEIEAILTQNDSKIEDNHYIKLESRYRNIVLVFDSANKLIGTASAPLKDQ